MGTYIMQQTGTTIYKGSKVTQRGDIRQQSKLVMQVVSAALENPPQTPQAREDA